MQGASGRATERLLRAEGLLNGVREIGPLEASRLLPGAGHHDPRIAITRAEQGQSYPSSGPWPIIFLDGSLTERQLTAQEFVTELNGNAIPENTKLEVTLQDDTYFTSWPTGSSSPMLAELDGSLSYTPSAHPSTDSIVPMTNTRASYGITLGSQGLKLPSAGLYLCYYSVVGERVENQSSTHLIYRTEAWLDHVSAPNRTYAYQRGDVIGGLSRNTGNPAGFWSQWGCLAACAIVGTSAADTIVKLMFNSDSVFEIDAVLGAFLLRPGTP